MIRLTSEDTINVAIVIGKSNKSLIIEENVNSLTHLVPLETNGYEVEGQPPDTSVINCHSLRCPGNPIMSMLLSSPQKLTLACRHSTLD